MPRRRFRRRRRRRRRRFKRAPIIARAPLFGKFKVVKLRYCTSGQLTPDPSGTFMVAHSVRPNSAASPNPLANSDTPQGWNLLAPLYEHHFTLGSKTTITFLPNGNTHSGIAFAEKSNISLNNLPSPTLHDLLSNRYVRYRMYGSGPGNAGVTKITYPFSTKKWFNVADVKDVVTLRAINSPGSAPVDEAYMNFGYQFTHPRTGLNATDFIDYCVVMDFIVLFTEPQNQ